MSYFDNSATSYDKWYDSTEGRRIFLEELTCLRRVQTECRGRWLEIGVGTGRFSQAMGIQLGLDLSLPMLTLAAQRGLSVTQGHAERLPFLENSFDGILMSTALPFFADAALALREAERVLKKDGVLLLGLIPGDALWGKLYTAKGQSGHPVYEHAIFRPLSTTCRLCTAANFHLYDWCGALFWKPNGPIPKDIQVSPKRHAGFVAMLWQKVAHRQH